MTNRGAVKDLCDKSGACTHGPTGIQILTPSGALWIKMKSAQTFTQVNKISNFYTKQVLLQCPCSNMLPMFNGWLRSHTSSRLNGISFTPFDDRTYHSPCNKPFLKVSISALSRAEPDGLMAALHRFSTPRKQACVFKSTELKTFFLSSVPHLWFFNSTVRVLGHLYLSLPLQQRHSLRDSCHSNFSSGLLNARLPSRSICLCRALQFVHFTRPAPAP